MSRAENWRLDPQGCGWIAPKRLEKIVEPGKEIDVAQSVHQKASSDNPEQIVKDQSEQFLDPKPEGISIPPPQSGWQH